METLITTITSRPYVFAFLGAYLFLAHRLWGWKDTLIWLVTGYFIAWGSEWLSIHYGFPYGEYHYLYENMPGELMVFGVPFFDSLSYPFLIFAGYTMGQWIMRKRERHVASPLFSACLGAMLTMLLDIIIDPLSHLGDQWFLGRIYYYAHPGWYFGVPFSNFAGWFLVALVVIAFNTGFFRPSSRQQVSPLPWLYPAFYFSIALFNICITWWIKAWALGLSSSLWCVMLIAVMICSQRKQPRVHSSDLEPLH